MTRVVKFTAEDKDRFNLVYEGFLLGGIVAGQKRSIEQKRQERRVHKALCAISVEAEKAQKIQSGEAVREMLPDGGEVKLEHRDLALLTSYIESVPWTVSRNTFALDTVDWLEGAEKRE